MKNFSLRLWTLTVCTALSAPLFAVAGAPITFKSGFYLGGGIGFDLMRVRHNMATILGAAPIANNNPELMIRGFKGDLFVGYDRFFKDYYYLGAEIFGNGSDAVTNSTQILGNALSLQSQVAVQNSYGFSFLPGIKADSNSLAYGRIGITRTRIRDTEFVRFGTANAWGSSINWVNGLTLGLGIGRTLTKNLSFRGEYDYTLYQSSTRRVNVNGPGGGALTATTQLLPTGNHLMLDFIYHI